MANPLNVPISKNSWVKVADTVQSGLIEIQQWQPDKYWKTYRVTGDAAPTIHAPDDPQATLIRNYQILITPENQNIDVYVYIVDLDGEVVVSL